MTARPSSDAGLAGEVSQQTGEPATRVTSSGVVRRGRMRTVFGWLAVVLIGIALWPATLGGITGLTVVNGESMSPTYTTGDVAVTVKVPSYSPGDVISFTVPEGQPGAGGFVIHRVLTAETGEYTTIGDNNPNPDQWVITDADITGKSVARLPGVGLILTPQVLPYVVALALGGIVTVLLWVPRRSEDDDERDETDERDLRTSGRRL